MTPKELTREATAIGWYFKEHGAKHDKYRHPTRPGVLTIPRHKDDIPVGTLKQLKKIAGLE